MPYNESLYKENQLNKVQIFPFQFEPCSSNWNAVMDSGLSFAKGEFSNGVLQANIESPLGQVCHIYE